MYRRTENRIRVHISRLQTGVAKWDNFSLPGAFPAPRCLIAYSSHGRSRCPQPPVLVTGGDRFKYMRTCSADNRHVHVICTSTVFLASSDGQHFFSPRRFCCWPLHRGRQTVVHAWKKIVRSRKALHIRRVQTGVENGHVSAPVYAAYIALSLLSVNQSIGRTHNWRTGNKL